MCIFPSSIVSVVIVVAVVAGLVIALLLYYSTFFHITMIDLTIIPDPFYVYGISCVYPQDVNSHSFTVVWCRKCCSGYGLDIAFFLGLKFFNCSGKPGKQYHRLSSYQLTQDICGYVCFYYSYDYSLHVERSIMRTKNVETRKGWVNVVANYPLQYINFITIDHFLFMYRELPNGGSTWKNVSYYNSRAKICSRNKVLFCHIFRAHHQVQYTVALSFHFNGGTHTHNIDTFT